MKTLEGFRKDVVPKETLFVKLGGASAIQAVVDGMYIKIFNDPHLKEFFTKTDKAKQKIMMRKFLTFISGGSNEY